MTIHKLVNALLINYILIKRNSDKCLNNNKFTNKICLQKQLNSEEYLSDKLPNDNSQTGKHLTVNLHLEKS